MHDNDSIDERMYLPQLSTEAELLQFGFLERLFGGRLIALVTKLMIASNAAHSSLEDLREENHSLREELASTRKENAQDLRNNVDWLAERVGNRRVFDLENNPEPIARDWGSLDSLPMGRKQRAQALTDNFMKEMFSRSQSTTPPIPLPQEETAQFDSLLEDAKANVELQQQGSTDPVN